MPSYSGELIHQLTKNSMGGRNGTAGHCVSRRLPPSLTFSPDSALSSSAFSNFPIGNLFALVSGLASLFSSRFPVYVCENCEFRYVQMRIAVLARHRLGFVGEDRDESACKRNALNYFAVRI